MVSGQKPKTTQTSSGVKKDIQQRKVDGILSSNSRITPISYKGIITPPSTSQAKDRLLWYKGKKIDDSTLITPEATLVRWSQPRNIVIVQPKKDPFARMIKELEKNESKKEQFYNKVSEKRNVLTLYPDIVNTLHEFDNIGKNFFDILKNTVELPPFLPDATSYNNRWKKGGPASHYNWSSLISSGVPDYIKKAYDEVMASMKNYPPIDFPPPPAKEFGTCFGNCDTVRRNKIQQREDEWMESFLKYEKGITNRSISIIKRLQELHLENDAEAAPLFTGLDKAMKFASARATNKVDLLNRKYGKDFSRLPSVVRVSIGIERQKQLLGVSDEDNSGTIIAQLSSQLDVFEKYLEQQMDAKNYDVALNTSLIIGIERQRQLLGASEDDNRMPELMEKLKAFNRFKIDVQLDYEGAREADCVQKTVFNATNLNPVYISLTQQDCKFSLSVYEDQSPNTNIAWYNYYRGVFEVPLDITNGTGTEVLTNDEGECYTKTHSINGLKLKVSGPLSKISFCEGTQDSLLFDNIFDRYQERKTDKRYDFVYIISKPLPDEIPEEIEQIEIELDELNKKIKDKETETFRKPSLQDLEEQYFDETRRRWLTQKIKEFEQGNDLSPFIFDAENSSGVIVDDQITTTYAHTDHNEVHEKATFTLRVKIVHDPLPYKKATK